jgi:hypothetical protein
MIPYLIAAIAGAAIAKKRAPHTAVKKTTCLGPRSGLHYQIDDFGDSGIIVVHFQGTKGIFQRKKLPARGFDWVRGAGNPQIQAAMRKDFS